MSCGVIGLIVPGGPEEVMIDLGVRDALKWSGTGAGRDATAARQSRLWYWERSCE